jgi:hypothetical protein
LVFGSRFRGGERGNEEGVEIRVKTYFKAKHERPSFKFGWRLKLKAIPVLIF